MEKINTTPDLHVLGVFGNKREALKCISVLHTYEYSDPDIYLATPPVQQSEDTPFLNMKKATKNPECAITGAGIGSITGITLGALIGTGMVPGINSDAAFGPFLTALVGLGAGGGFGAIIGAYIGNKVPEDDAKAFDKLNQHEILLSVHVKNERETLQTQKIFKELGARKIILNKDNERYDDSAARDRTTQYH